jgi:hypothetical protein
MTRPARPTGMLSVVRQGLLVLLALLPATAARAGELPLFDAHLHYSAEDAAQYTAADILSILDGNGVARAVVTATPPQQALSLYRHAPARIVPFLGVYRQPGDKQDWHRDTTLPARVEAQLAAGPWAGIGELHLFADARHSPVFRRLAELAVQHGLPLLLHGDPAVIDSLYEHTPGVTVIWAHGGTYPWPPLIRDYLQRYPGLHADLSVRDGRIAPGGVLDPAWTPLLLEFSDRLLIGVDTYSTRRWQQFDRVAGSIRDWLAQLPGEVAERIAHRNAASLFATAGPR